MIQQNDIIVKEEWMDMDMDIGPTVFQPMDGCYGSSEGPQRGEHIEPHLETCEIKREYGISIGAENSDESHQSGHEIPKKPELDESTLHAECLESICCVLLPRLRIFQCDMCRGVYADQLKFQEHTCSVKSSVKCKLCGKYFEDLSLLIKHIMHLHQLYMCQICGRILKSRSIYLFHYRTIHFEKRENFHCVSCDKIYKGKQALRDHIRYSHSSAVYKCAECDKAFKVNVALQRHIVTKHRNERHECEHCFKVYKAHHLLRTHVYKLHSGVKHVCEVCKRRFTTEATLRLHSKVTHSSESDLKKYECDKCCKIFKWPNHLLSHVKNNKCFKADTVKAIERNGKIGSLEKKSCNFFNKNDNLKEKQLAENAKSAQRNRGNIVRKGFDMPRSETGTEIGRQPKMYTCDYCKTTLRQKTTLRIHIQSTHATGSHKCQQCGKTFRCNSYLLNHIANVHISEQHECDKCGKVFKSKGLLWTHLHSTHSTRELQCTKCPRVFRVRASLRYHMVAVHSQERHKCDTCKRVFKVRSLLLQHIKRNHSNKTYECDNCSRVFKMRSSLRMHLLSKICYKGKK